jgi:uncharacterized membrane protein YeaQ/YmgE (transglycosylase-associated protein family)
VSSVSIEHLPALAALGFGNVALDPGGCIAWVFAAGIAGWLAGLVVRGHSFGCLANIALGLVGAVIGLFIVSLLPVTFAGQYHFIGTTVVAFLGAFVLAALGRLIGGSGRYRRYRSYQ